MPSAVSLRSCESEKEPRKKPTMLSVYPSLGRDWNHELAGFRRLAILRRALESGRSGPLWNHLMAETTSLEASSGPRLENAIKAGSYGHA